MIEYLHQLWNQGYRSLADLTEEVSVAHPEIDRTEIYEVTRRFVRDKNIGNNVTGKSYGEYTRY